MLDLQVMRLRSDTAMAIVVMTRNMKLPFCITVDMTMENIVIDVMKPVGRPTPEMLCSVDQALSRATVVITGVMQRRVMVYKRVIHTQTTRKLRISLTLSGTVMLRHRSKEMKTAIQQELKAKFVVTQPPGGGQRKHD